jgi:glycosyltransferase involved in cell wall biosynthesis
VRIGFDAKRLFNNFTGLGNYSRFVVNALVARYPPEEYYLYTPKLKAHPEVSPYLDGGRYVRRQPEGFVEKRMSSWWRSFSLNNVLKEDGVDVYHGLSNELPSGVSSGGPFKAVLTVHDLIFRRFPELYNPIDVQIYTWKLRNACKNADHIIAISQQTANDLKEFLEVDEKKLQVIYQGHHPNFGIPYDKSALQMIREKYQLPAEFILCVGTLEKRKNAATIIKALSIMKEQLPLVLVGKQTNYMTDLQQLITERKLTDRVKFLHNVAFADLPGVYQMASVFVYPSVFEGFGIPIVEAIASGVPVVSSMGSSFAEAGGPHCLYCNPADPQAFADAMDRAIENTLLRDSMISGSKEYIKRFAPAVIADEVMKVYKSIL